MPLSWSRYFGQLEEWLASSGAPDWVDRVKAMNDLLRRGDAVNQKLSDRSAEALLRAGLRADQPQLPLEDKTAVRDYFTSLSDLYRNLNHAPEESPTYAAFRKQIDDLAAAASPRRRPLPEKHALAGSTTKA